MVDPGKKRLVAEWEPALGAFVTWPAALLGALLRDPALDAHLWVLVTDAASEIDAAAWFASQGVSPDRVTFVHAPQGDDAVWVRDWGPHPVMDEHGQLWCVGPRYVYATPFTAHEPGAPLETADREPLAALEYEPVDQRAQPALSRALGLPFEKLPHAHAGDRTERRVHGPLAAGPASGEIEYAVEATPEDGRVQRWPRPSKAWLRAAID